MPQLFAADDASKAERYAVARYLVSLGGPLQESAKRASAKDRRSSAVRGHKVFVSIGCAACHLQKNGKETKTTPTPSFYGLLSPGGPHEVFPLGDLGSKTTEEKLTAYLADPLAIDPSGRMPNMVLQKDEAKELAHYLCQGETDRADIDLPNAPEKEQLLSAFRRTGAGDREAQAFGRLPEDRQWRDLGKRLVIQKQCNSCHTIAPAGSR